MRSKITRVLALTEGAELGSEQFVELARKPQAVRQVLPDLLRDLGAPFPAIWDQLHAAHGPRDAARLFAKVLGQLDTQGAAVVVPALTAALATGTPLLLALTTETPYVTYYRCAACK